MRTRTVLLAGVVLGWALGQTPAAGLVVTLDSGGSGSVTLADDDMDHIIDFDVVGQEDLVVGPGGERWCRR